MAVALCLPAMLAGALAANPPARDRSYWRAIVASGYAVPEGESAAKLLLQLSGLLGSPDPEERDEFGYGIPARWIYVQRLLSPEELRELLALWTSNLRRGIGEHGTDSVLLRSFSALDLSILAALDNEDPFLEQPEFRRLLDAALAYLKDEQDVRGFVAGTGWLHSVAHTADLLKFLGRSRHLRGEDQSRILDAIAAKMRAPEEQVYRYGEDERLARAVLSLLHRKDLERDAVKRWLDGLGTRSRGMWEGTLDTARFAEVQNTKNLLKSLYVMLSAEKSGTTPDVLRTQVLQAIQAL
jgi:hypothetical protein